MSHLTTPSVTTIVVNSSGDADNLPCVGNTGDCTLRSAITKANTGTFNNIRFDSSVTLIQPASTLPHITAQGTWIDGSTALGVPVLVLVDGRLIPNGGGDVLVIQANDVTISNLSMNNASTSNAEIAIWSGKDVRIAGDTLGLGSITCLNLQRNGGYGLYISSTSGDGTQFNSTAYIWGNTIGCHTSHGIWLNGASYVGIGIKPDNLSAQGNNIGTDGNGSAANGGDGVHVTNGVFDQITANLIAGNAGNGIVLTGASTSQAFIISNRIGLASNGRDLMGNSLNGVAIQSGAAGTDFLSNVISGNGQDGVLINNGGGGNRIDESNYIGLTTDGLAAAPNGGQGVAIIADNSSSNGIGFDSDFAGRDNFISGNGLAGVYISNSSGWLISNLTHIGVAKDNIKPVGNGLQGVLVLNSTALTIHPHNVSNNGGAGIAVTGNSSGVNLSANVSMAISNNGGLPIDLGNNGPTPGGSGICPCPNLWTGYPLITATNGSVISGTIPYCFNLPCRVDVYRASGNPAVPRGGGGFLSSTVSDLSGKWSVTMPGGLTRFDVTLVATDHNGNSSEMSPRPQLLLPLILR